MLRNVYQICKEVNNSTEVRGKGRKGTRLKLAIYINITFHNNAI